VLTVDNIAKTIYRVMSWLSEGMKGEGGRMNENSRDVSGSDSSFIPRPSSFPLRILVAEDNELSAQILEQLLIRQGHRVRLANNGLEALSVAKEEVFDLLLVDIHMPELDGCEVVRVDGALTDRGPRALPRDRHGRPPDQTGQASRIVGGHRSRDGDPSAPQASRPAVARRASSVGRLRGRRQPVQENVPDISGASP
jgi:hypothetical protein